MPKIKDVKNYFNSSLRVQALADLEIRYNLSCFIQNKQIYFFLPSFFYVITIV